ncbi:Superoxide dismutase [Paenibacillus vortex V453]|uniref:superoxide dismutase n=1 Tax=Paenibacillus vortex V453 TaxID=715225 RepID=A0A2R9SZV3_9BACL|nr:MULTISPECIES: Fe-Mn family superoxide dismutase [Paenibacillus]EFU42883.1 Superoxide dismutase [Paenibacillus vortex V453]MDH6673341.1 Fe-Mn family superoxide dismutase [Paenibacillus sp. LBL]
MLFHYGAKLPVRLLEEIRYWKHQERKHTGLIKAVVPDLEPVYVQMLDQWALVFADTEKVADELLRHILSNHAPPSPQVLAQVEQLLRASCEQSREFIRQLHGLKENSEAVQKVPLAGTVVHHVIRESEYFLNALETLNSAGALERFMDMPQQSMTLHEASSPPPSLSEAELSIQGMGDSGQAVPIGGHRLPPLPYAYDALEPYIDEKTMRIHHDIHHKSYVDGLNKAEKKLEEARKSGDFELVKHWERELAFNGAGHYLHTIFWNIMNPRGGGEPGGELAQQIKNYFGSFDRFKNQFTEAADKVEGGGWAILVWSPRSHRLEILQAEKHQNLSQWDVVPLLTLDVWEHAYYLKHQNKRKDYINDWWKVVYWPEVADRFKHASKLKWKPF